MEKSKTVFLTTIFPASEVYLDDFFSSLQTQTYKDFDVLVINDGIENLIDYETKYVNLNIIEKKVSKEPSKNREIGINWALKLGYKYIVFGDSDDYFSENRIQRTVESLQSNDIVFNELVVFNKKYRINNFLMNQIEKLDRIQETIYQGNVFGFSNIAIKSDIIKKKICFDENLIAVDWFFITTLLIQNNYQVKFLADVQTYYRQYNNNTIGLSMQLTEEKLILGIKVKEIHYSAITKYCNKHDLKNHFKIFENKLKQVQNLKEKLINNSFKNKYIEIINLNFKELFTGWWSETINLETYFKYENKNK